MSETTEQKQTSPAVAEQPRGVAGKPWCFLHVPKTAGTSFVSEVASCLNVANVFLSDEGYAAIAAGRLDFIGAMRERLEDSFSELRKGEVQFLTGHLHYRSLHPLRDLLPDLQMITFLRDPVDRVISDYRYRMSPTSPDHMQFRDRFADFPAYLAAEGESDKTFRYLCKSLNETVEDLIDRLERDFAMVGLVERMPHYRKLFWQMVGQPMPPPQTANVTRNPDIGTEALERYRQDIVDANSRDAAIHAHFLRAADGSLQERVHGTAVAVTAGRRSPERAKAAAPTARAPINPKLERRLAAFVDTDHVRSQSAGLAEMSDSAIFSFLASAKGWASGASLVRPNALFDPQTYRQLNPDIGPESEDESLLAHFLLGGLAEGRAFSHLFDADFARRQAGLPPEADLWTTLVQWTAVSRLRPLSAHPLIDAVHLASQVPGLDPRYAYDAAVWGDLSPQLDPNPFFDTADYLSRSGLKFPTLSALLRDQVENHDIRPMPAPFMDRRILAFVLGEGHRDGNLFATYLAAPNRPDLPVSDLFDAALYREGLQTLGIDPGPEPFLHFLRHGRDLAVSPSRMFDLAHFRRQSENPEATLRDYLEGGFRRFSPHPGIDLEFTASRHSDFRKGKDDVLDWFLSRPHRQRPSLHPAFDAAAYLDANPDLDSPYVCPAKHFLQHGLAEGRRPGPWFSGTYVRSHQRESMYDGTSTQAWLASATWKRPRILFVSHDASLTGAPAIILRLLQDFSKAGEHDCLTILGAGGPRLPDFEAAGHCCILSARPYTESWTQEATDAEVARLLSGLPGPQPIVALVNSAESRHIGVALSRLGIPVISLVHEVASAYPPGVFADILAASRHVVFPSDYVLDEAKQALAIEPGKAEVFGQGLLDDNFGRVDRAMARVALRHNLGLPEAARIVIGCGTMNLRKGVDLFAMAAQALFADEQAEGPGTWFVWVGGGPTHSESPAFFARQLARKAGFDDRLILVAETGSVEPYFAGADVFVLTSRIDPFPCVVHEAMATGLPVISFEGGGGAAELHGDLGRTAPFGDPVQLAREIRRALEEAAQDDGSARSSRRDHILNGWSSDRYYRHFRTLVDAVGTRPAAPKRPKARPSPRPVSGPRVALCGTGLLSSENAALLALEHALSDRGLPVEMHRVDSHSAHLAPPDHAISTFHPALEDYHSMAFPGDHPMVRLLRQLDRTGGGVVVMTTPLLAQVPQMQLSSRMALAGLSCADPVGLHSLPVAPSLALLLAPGGSAGWSQTRLPLPKWGPEQPQHGTERLVLDLLDVAVPGQALVSFAPLVAAFRKARPEAGIALLVPARAAAQMERLRHQLQVGRGVAVLPVGHDRDVARLLRPGDVVASTMQDAGLPVGAIWASLTGARTICLASTSEHRRILAQCLPDALILWPQSVLRLEAWLAKAPVQRDSGLRTVVVETFAAMLEQARRGAVFAPVW